MGFIGYPCLISLNMTDGLKCEKRLTYLIVSIKIVIFIIDMSGSTKPLGHGLSEHIQACDPGCTGSRG